MANKRLFQSAATRAPDADTTNTAGGKAYKRSDEEALAQYASTGCLGDTYYANSRTELMTIIDLCNKVSPEFLAKAAVYCRKEGYMKDVPSTMLSMLACKNTKLFKKAFPLVVDNGRMVRNFAQIMRSGATGRKSLGSAPKNQVVKFLIDRPYGSLFRESVGRDPSISDVIKMVHPKPGSKMQAGMFAYLIGKTPRDADTLPDIINEYESFKNGETKKIPDYVSFQKLSSMNLTPTQWKQIAKTMTWHQTRINLNTLMRHEVFTGANAEKMIDMVADRLRNPDIIKRVKVFPYQIMAAFLNIDSGIPTKIKNALQDAMEIACGNIPKYEGNIYIFPDVSGSMTWSSITGSRGSATSQMRCIDVAALISSSILRRNPLAKVMPFDNRVHSASSINSRDSIMTNATKLAGFGGGGTNCSLPLARLNSKGSKADLIIYVSDSESWCDGGHNWGGTETMNEWKRFKRKNKNAKMVCIDLTPSSTVQAKSDKDILNIGGFSDNVFKVINDFCDTDDGENYWVKMIKATEL